MRPAAERESAYALGRLKDLKVEFETFRDNLRKVTERYLTKKPKKSSQEKDSYQAEPHYNSLGKLGREQLSSLCGLISSLDELLAQENLDLKQWQRRCASILNLLKLLHPELQNKETSLFYNEILKNNFEHLQYLETFSSDTIRDFLTNDAIRERNARAVKSLSDEKEMLDETIKTLNQTYQELNQTHQQLLLERTHNRSIQPRSQVSFFANGREPKRNGELPRGAQGKASGAKATSDLDKLCKIVNASRVKLIELLLSFRRDCLNSHAQFLDRVKAKNSKSSGDSVFLQDAKFADTLIKRIVPDFLTQKSVSQILDEAHPINDDQLSLLEELNQFIKMEEHVGIIDTPALQISKWLEDQSETHVAVTVASTVCQLFNSKKEGKLFENDLEFSGAHEKRARELNATLKREAQGQGNANTKTNKM